MKSRNCTACGLVKEVAEFHRHSSCKGGYNSVCKECRLPLSKRHYNEKTKEQLILERSRSRASRKELPFDLELEDIVIPELCPVLGIPIDVPSIDRHVPELGYVKGNIVIMSNRANVLKNNGTVDEFEKLLAYLKERSNEL